MTIFIIIAPVITGAFVATFGGPRDPGHAWAWDPAEAARAMRHGTPRQRRSASRFLRAMRG